MNMAIAAAVMPVVKQVGMEIAREVAVKMAQAEMTRLRDRLEKTAQGTGKETVAHPGLKEKGRRFGARVAFDVLDSKALDTGMGAVLGAVTAAVTGQGKRKADTSVRMGGESPACERQQERKTRQEREKERDTETARGFRRR